MVNVDSDTAVAHMIHRAQLEEATETGPALTPSAGPNVWRWPLRSVTDPAYWEVSDCD